MLKGKNLQDRVTALMFAENDMVLSKVRPRFFALWEGNTVELSTVIERSLSGQAFPWRKNSLVGRQVEISARHTEMRVTTWVSEGGKEKSS